MPELGNGVIVDVIAPTGYTVEVESPLSPQDQSVTVVPVKGSPGESGTVALDAHIASSRPHAAAETGRDFASWYNAQTV